MLFRSCRGNALVFVQAWSAKNCSILGQVRVNHGSNEISAIPELLDDLLLQGKIITIDAIGTQRSITKKVIHGGADYLLPLKKNHPLFYENVSLVLDDISDGNLPNMNSDYHQTIDKGHGRIEHRSCWTTNQIDWLDVRNKWSGLCSLSLVKTTIFKGDKIVKSKRYFISSLPANAALILRTVRSHWSIENRLHWPLDVVFREDTSMVKSFIGAQNIALLRRVTISLLQKSPLNQGFASQRAKSACSFSTLIAILLSTAF